jgi:hypothetical protein
MIPNCDLSLLESHRFVSISLEFSLDSQLKDKYIEGLVSKRKYGYEVISIDKKSLQNIKKVFLSLEQNDIEAAQISDRIKLDMSATKSLSIVSSFIVIGFEFDLN